MRSLHFIFVFSLLLAFLMQGVPTPAFAQVAVAVAPPALPVYEQPVCVGPSYIWTPGYWAWGDDDYFWVPGTWVLAPVGLLWTPGYWAWSDGDGAFIWNAGYWSPEVGFYGGVVYGFGYIGVGYEGGYWTNGAYFYNCSVNNVANVTTITNVYNKTVLNNVTVSNVSYYGGAGGTTATPTGKEQAAAHQPHTAPTAAQMQHEQTAKSNPALAASQNHGKPPIAATQKPAQLSGPGVVAAKAAAPYHPTPAPGAKPGGAVPRGATGNKPAANQTEKPATPQRITNEPNPNKTSKPAPPPKPKPEPPPKEQQQEKEKQTERPKPPQPPQK
jgi:hypothetical protein